MQRIATDSPSEQTASRPSGASSYDDSTADLESLLNDALPPRFPVLVVDDDQSVLDVTRLVLSRFRFEGRGIECLEANSAEQARDILQRRDDIAVALLDVVMEDDDAGLTLVQFIRNDLANQRLRILMRTGQAGFAPEYRVVSNYDINDYLSKSESTQERLYVSLTTALRGYRDIITADLYATRASVAEEERRVAARALEAKTQFLAHLSHEIRNPLTGMIGIVELLQQRPQDTVTADLVRDLGFTVQSLLGVVDDVLDIAKIEAGKLNLHPQAFNVRQWLERGVAMFTANMKQKDIRFVLDIEDDVPERVIGDSARLRQILVNFLSNACKFTPAGGAITVRLTAQPQDASVLLNLLVKDTGIGIERERLNEIFQPYEQGGEQTSQLYGGTGLGLSLCRNLAQMMGGYVGVVSQRGDGATFWLEVPVQATDDAPVGAAESNRPLRVVVCEDDATNQRTLRVILEKKGLIVDAFDHGQALLDSEVWRQADVILMDCHMPVLNGMDTTQALRKLGCTVPVIALTAGVSDIERQRCLDMGMDTVMAKPVDYTLLHDQLLAHVRHGRHPVRVAT